MDEPVFTPSYGSWVLWVSVGFGFVLIWIELGTIIFAVATAFVLIMCILLYVKRIRFGDQSFVIERFLLPSKELNYSDVVDIGKKIKINHWGYVYLEGMTNANDLCEIMAKRVKQSRRSGRPATPKVQELLNSKRKGLASPRPDWLAMGEGVLATLGALIGAWVPAVLIDSSANNAYPGAGAGATLLAFFFCTPLALAVGILTWAVLRARHRTADVQRTRRPVSLELLATTLAGLVIGGLPWLALEGLHSIGLIPSLY